MTQDIPNFKEIHLKLNKKLIYFVSCIERMLMLMRHARGVYTSDKTYTYRHGQGRLIHLQKRSEVFHGLVFRRSERVIVERLIVASYYYKVNGSKWSFQKPFSV